MRFIIYPYNTGSESARKLSQRLDGMRVRRDGRYRYKIGDFIVNFGNSHDPVWLDNVPEGKMLNRPRNVALAANKLSTFLELDRAGVAHVPFTTSKEIAEAWNRVFVRNVLDGHSGEGIEVVETMNDESRELRAIAGRISEMGRDDLARIVADSVVSGNLPDAPLYTKGIVNCGEYRVHVFCGEVIDYRKKSRLYGDDPDADRSDIRTLENGWIYRTSNLRQVDRISELAVSAISALGLDFGAVDIIKDDTGAIFVLEVNTAVGMDRMTLDNYEAAIRRNEHATRN